MMPAASRSHPALVLTACWTRAKNSRSFTTSVATRCTAAGCASYSISSSCHLSSTAALVLASSPAALTDSRNSRMNASSSSLCITSRQKGHPCPWYRPRHSAHIRCDEMSPFASQCSNTSTSSFSSMQIGHSIHRPVRPASDPAATAPALARGEAGWGDSECWGSSRCWVSCCICSDICCFIVSRLIRSCASPSRCFGCVVSSRDAAELSALAPAGCFRGFTTCSHAKKSNTRPTSSSV
mmetsp:Transcript_24914/g.50609  ORF Transcript_24914/g.50609 Transcript_24914/m.50609 type:complete len:239 (+) Transcript_24914:468-1184(+)